MSEPVFGKQPSLFEWRIRKVRLNYKSSKVIPVNFGSIVGSGTARETRRRGFQAASAGEWHGWADE
jgi:hypothetical protein